MAQIQTSEDGRHDFDFLFGRRRIHNRKVVDTLDPSSDEWVEFEADRGGGADPGRARQRRHVLHAVAAADRRPVRGVHPAAVRPGDRALADLVGVAPVPGGLDQPVEGRFAGGRGEFLCDDVIGGRPVKVRYEWTRAVPDVQPLGAVLLLR